MNNPMTISEHTADNSSILRWLQAYPCMRCNPRAWFAHRDICQQELQELADAGLVDVAAALGWRPRPLKANSRPVIASHPQPVGEAA